MKISLALEVTISKLNVSHILRVISLKLVPLGKEFCTSETMVHCGSLVHAGREISLVIFSVTSEVNFRSWAIV